ncbi:MAG TPA: hypothetical protein VN677_05995 [Gemmatimonadaceae bacterium]|nr:hypothetical protein [Gemmatimonadaceae bacterium]
MRLEFRNGPARHEQEARELSWPLAGLPFGDIGGNGRRAAAELIAQSESFRWRQPISNTVTLDNQFHSPLPGFEILIALIFHGAARSTRVAPSLRQPMRGTLSKECGGWHLV